MQCGLVETTQVIKFASGGSGQNTGVAVTEKDIDMAKLYQAVSHLDENLAVIEREMEQECVQVDDDGESILEWSRLALIHIFKKG